MKMITPSFNRFSAILSVTKILSQGIYLSPYFYMGDDKDDVLDEFTSKLTKLKKDKWELKKQFAEKKFRNNRETCRATQHRLVRSGNDIANMYLEEIDYLFEKAIAENNITAIRKLVNQCIECDKNTSLNVIINTLHFGFHKGDVETVMGMIKLCQKMNPKFVEGNSHFEHYVAGAMWVKGNIPESLKIFERVYTDNINVRHKIRNIIKYCIQDITSKHSEVILMKLVEFSEELGKKFNDYYPLACIWQQCFISEWFTDQQLAMEILEKHKDIYPVVVGRMPHLVRMSLNNDRIEVVYRLTEFLLSSKMETQLVQVLLTLIDHWVRKGDLKQCNEIIKWSIKNNIALPTVVQRTLLKEKDTIKSQPESDSVKRHPTEFKF